MQTKVPIDLLDSTEQSLIFLQKVESFIPETFDTTDIDKFINYKWRKNYRMYVPLIIYAIYILILVDTALNYSQSYTNKPGILLFNFFIFISEVYQVISSEGHEYFKQVENWIDIIGIIYIYLYASKAPLTEYDEELDRQYLSIGLFLNLGNFILQIAFLTKTLRTTWIIIENSLVKVV